MKCQNCNSENKVKVYNTGWLESGWIRVCAGCARLPTESLSLNPHTRSLPPHLQVFADKFNAKNDTEKRQFFADFWERIVTNKSEL